MGIVAELEKAFITMRLSGGRINKAKNGGYAGGSTALGYRAEKKGIEDRPGASGDVRMIFRMKRHRRMSLGAIAGN